jgi:hypothetical protein
VGSSKANKQILGDYSRMEKQDGRVLPSGLISGIIHIPYKEKGTGYFFNRDKVNLDIIWLKDDSLAGGMRGRLE